MHVTTVVSACILSASLSAPLAAQGICGTDAAVEVLGAGTPGVAGVPRLVPVGAPILDAPFAFSLAGGAPSASGMLLLAAAADPVPLGKYGAVLQPDTPLVVVPFTTDGDGTAAFFATNEVPVALCGVEVVMQVVVFDGAAQGGAAFSAGLRLRFGVRGGGRLFPAERYSPGTETEFDDDFALVGADVDGDGVTDLMSGSKTYQEVSVLRGRGDGTFEQITVVDVGFDVLGLDAADLDGDGDVDLAAIGKPDVLAVLLGDGSGAFVLQPTVVVGPGITDLVAADLSGDGLVDLAILGGKPAPLAYVAVRLGQGDGTFVAAPQVDLDEQGACDLAVGDVTGDLVPDLVAIAFDTFTFDDQIYVVPGLGGGAFGAWTSLPAPGACALAIGQLDDGPPLDLAVVGDISFNGAAWVYAGLGGGTFATPLVIPVGAQFGAGIGIADVDGDGAADLVVSTEAAYIVWDDRSLLAVVRGGGDGTFAAPSTTTAIAAGESLVLEDLDGDGDLDAVVGAGALAVFEARGDGTFVAALESPQLIASGQPPTVATWLSLADLDDDGIDDAVFQSTNDPGNLIGVAHGLGGGLFGPPAAYDAGGSDAPVLADVDADGVLDVVAVNVISAAPDTVSVLAGLGGGVFGAPIAYPVGAETARRVAAADLDADSALDLVVTTDAQVSLLFGLGDGTFAAPVALATPTGVDALAVGDQDGDGVPDLVVGSRDTGIGPAQYLAIAHGNGDGTFAPWDLVTPQLQFPADIALADLDGDGLGDLVVAYAYLTSEAIEVFLAGPGGFTGTLFGDELSFDLTRVRVADVDGDGELDVVASSGVDLWADVAVFAGLGDGTLAPPRRFVAGQVSTVVVHDVNGDGAPDLVALGATPPATIRTLVNQSLE